MNVFIRADASRTLGAGHVMRCLTLAEALRDKGAKVSFICRDLEGNLIDFLEGKHGFQVHCLADPHLEFQGQPDTTQTSDTVQTLDALQTKAVLQDQGEKPDWLIVDHYELAERWESWLRPHTQHLMVIDDLANRSHDCDLLLDQNLSSDETRYDALVPPSCLKLLGPQYALLREEFWKVRQARRVRTGELKRVLVSFGGSDPTNETTKVVLALRELNSEVALDVVIGTANPHRAELERLAASLPNARLHVQVNNMASLMNEADLALGASGSTSWERCCVGLPTVVISVADNQRAIAEALEQARCALYLGPHHEVKETDIFESVSRLRRNPRGLETLSQNCLNVLDGCGAGRVAQTLASLSGAKQDETKYSYR